MADITPELDLQDLSKWKVADLKKELKVRGLSTNGNKNELVDRLQIAVHGIEGALEAGMEEADGGLGDTGSVEAADSEEMLDEDEVLGVDDTLDDDIDISLSKDESLAMFPEPQTTNKDVDVEEPPAEKKITLKRDLMISGKENVEESDAKPKIRVIAAESLLDSKKTSVKISSLSQQERLKMRAEKFGTGNSLDSKKEARAARFGTASNLASLPVGTDMDTLKKRAERFGTAVSPALSKLDQEEKLKKRQERFGITDSTVKQQSLKSLSLDEKKKLRAERFQQK